MGLIGDPISQIMTPTFINPIFSNQRFDIICIPLHISDTELETAWDGMKAIKSIIGFGVTLPHKKSISNLCDNLDPLAKHVGAVNLVRREKDGSFCGYQFDGKGFIRGLKKRGHNVEGRNCLLLGAGGVGMAIAFALADEGVENLTILNRSKSKAIDLAERLNAAHGRPFVTTNFDNLRNGQVIINATSLGLKEKDPVPIKTNKIDSSMLVADVVAKPEITPLLSEARNRGAEIHSGIHMITGQIDLIASHLAVLWGKNET